MALFSKKQAYLLALMLILLDFWDIKPIGLINNDIYLLFSLAFIALGFVAFKNPGFSLKSNELKAFRWIVLGMLISMIPAYLFYGQTIVQSIVTYRWQLVWAVVPLLFHLKPTEDDIVRCSLAITVITFGMGLLQELLPSLYVIQEKDFYASLTEDSGMYINGFEFSVIPLFYFFGKLRKSFDKKSVLIVLFCLAFIFIVQNRSALFTVMVIIGVSLLGIKSRYKIPALVMTLTICLVVFFYTKGTWSEMMAETAEQIGDDDYNRTKAYLFYFSPLANPSFLTYIFGNGYLSAHSSPLMEEMMREGVYNSDVGYTGFWNQFGIIPIIAFTSIIFKPLFHSNSYFKLCTLSDKKKGRKRLSIIKVKLTNAPESKFYLKAFAVFLLITSLTIGYYAQAYKTLLFGLYYYLVSRNSVSEK